jgi:hypothetical protein
MKPETSQDAAPRRRLDLRRAARLSLPDRVMSVMLAVVLVGIAYLALGWHR